MPDLAFKVLDVGPARHAAVPTLNFRLEIRQRRVSLAIQSVSLQCQIRIEPKMRIYKPDEKQRLTDLFGAPDRWRHTLNSLLWTHAAMVVPRFSDTTKVVELPVPCSFDFNVAATKYFHGLDSGEVPLLLLFSGSVFYRDGDGALAMDPISWNEEIQYFLPVAVWKDMMENYYPNCTWLCVDRRVFEALYEYKRRYGYTGFDEALTGLLPQAERQAS